MKRACLPAALAAALFSAGCGEVSRTGRSPGQLVIQSLEAAPGHSPDDMSGTLLSDVETLVLRTIDGEQVLVPTIFNDVAEIELRVQLRDVGIPGVPTTPSSLNDITITRYRVSYRRADGRNTPGVDVPFGFDSAMTFTVPAGGSAAMGFEIVKSLSKLEAPLRALVNNGVLIYTIAEVTVYGHDQAGNEVSATGTIGVNFGNFADPE